MKFLGNGPVFVLVYIVFMLPTYILPWMGSNSSLLGAASAGSGLGIPPQTIMHLVALAALIAITWFRGALVGKQWLVILPILASLFDMVPVLSSIPLVPTVMHLVVIIMGVAAKPVLVSAT